MMNRALRYCLIATAAISLISGCQQSEVPDHSDQAFRARPVVEDTALAAPVPPAPQPDLLPAWRLRDGEPAIVSQADRYSAVLKKAGPYVEIELHRAPTLREPAFESGVVTGPREVEARLLQDIEQHPQFRRPLMTVLEAAASPRFSEISLSLENERELEELRNALAEADTSLAEAEPGVFEF